MRFYVYTLIGPDGAVFYVGKGQGKRMYQHRGEAKNGHSCHKCNKIRKLWREGADYTELVVFQTDDEQEAFTKEIELIASTPNLCNVTTGGEGGSVRPEVRQERGARWQVAISQYDEQKRIAQEQRSAGWRGRLAEFDRRLDETRKARRLAKRQAKLEAQNTL
jgi:hypothetical protein